MASSKNSAIPYPVNEAERVAALHSLRILDTAASIVYDDLVRAAQDIAQTPFACLSLIDIDRQWFKARRGFDLNQINRDISFGTYTILSDLPFLIESTMDDARFQMNPLVRGRSQIRAYAGFPLIINGDLAIGSLCLLDQAPRKLQICQLDGLRRAADLIARRLQSLAPLDAAHSASSRFASMGYPDTSRSRDRA